MSKNPEFMLISNLKEHFRKIALSKIRPNKPFFGDLGFFLCINSFSDLPLLWMFSEMFLLFSSQHKSIDVWHPYWSISRILLIEGVLDQKDICCVYVVFYFFRMLHMFTGSRGRFKDNKWKGWGCHFALGAVVRQHGTGVNGISQPCDQSYHVK
jgi:hypothetical protein